MPSPQEILRKFWGFNAFRSIQEKVINAVLEGKDVLALMPTGGGKSICFQVPALMSDGICIVVTPLIALMNDQVERLKSKGIPAGALHSGLNYYEQSLALRKCIAGDYKFLYVSPERLQSEDFQNSLQQMEVNLIAVDEAHCISQWGFDFRPSYLQIAELRDFFPAVPVLALTASATPQVQKDIVHYLRFGNYQVLLSSFARPNLSFSIFRTESKINKIREILTNVAGSALIYCRTRKLTQDVASLLQQHGISADYYHAGLTQEERADRQSQWMQNRIRTIVCTNAFGMGIDKADVRLVIHHDAPDSLENYYQEAGRAGRDGEKAYAVLLYYAEDLTDLEKMPDVRFPSFEFIRECYQYIGNYLQVPVGNGKGNYYDFELNTFLKTFSLPPLQTIYALKALEQQGFLEFNESIFLPAKAVFTTDRDMLNYLEETEPELDRLVKCLLRLYEGIFDHRVSVFVPQVARYCHWNEETALAQLHRLQRYEIIEFLPSKETPQIHYVENRAPTDYLNFNHALYLHRREVYVHQVESVLSYIGLQEACRMRFLCRYFGEKTVTRCGICDNCLQWKKTLARNQTDIVKVCESVLAYIPETGIGLELLREKLKSVSKGSEALTLLEEEGDVYWAKDGVVRKKS